MGVINHQLITRVTNLYIRLSDVVCKIASNDIDKKSPLFPNFDELNLCLCFLQINHTGSYLAISTKWLWRLANPKNLYIYSLFKPWCVVLCCWYWWSLFSHSFPFQPATPPNLSNHHTFYLWWSVMVKNPNFSWFPCWVPIFLTQERLHLASVELLSFTNIAEASWRSLNDPFYVCICAYLCMDKLQYQSGTRAFWSFWDSYP